MASQGKSSQTFSLQQELFFPCCFISPTTPSVPLIHLELWESGQQLAGWQRAWQAGKSGHGVGSETTPRSQWSAATMGWAEPKTSGGSSSSQRHWILWFRQMSQDMTSSICRYFLFPQIFKEKPHIVNSVIKTMMLAIVSIASKL